MALPVAGVDSIAPDALLGTRAQRVVHAAPPLSRWIPAAIFALALLLRLTFIATNPRPLRSDEIDYDNLGWTLATTGSYATDGHPTAYRPVGYPAAIAAVYAVVGHHPAAVTIVQAVLDSATAVLLFLLFAGVDRRAGILAGATWAVLPAAILFASQLFSECLTVFALVLFLHLANAIEISPQRARAVGLHLGFMTLLRPLVSGFFALAAPLALLSKNPARRVAMLAFVLVPIGLWAARNALVIGAPVITTSVGTNLFIGNRPGATGSYAPVDPTDAPPGGDTELTRDAAAGRAAFQSIQTAPLEAAVRLIKKVAFLLTSEGELVAGHFAGEVPEGTRYRERLRSVPPWLHILVSGPTAIVMILGILGLGSRRPDRIGRLFYALLFATVLSCAIFFGGSRFRFPLLVLLVGFAAEFVVNWRTRVASFTRGRLAMAAAVIGSCIAVWLGEAALIAGFGP